MATESSVHADDDVVDGDEDQLDDEPDDPHDREADRRGESDLGELCGRKKDTRVKCRVKCRLALSGGASPREAGSGQSGWQYAQPRKTARIASGGLAASVAQLDEARTAAVGLRAPLDQPDAVARELRDRLWRAEAGARHESGTARAQTGQAKARRMGTSRGRLDGRPRLITP